MKSRCGQEPFHHVKACKECRRLYEAERRAKRHAEAQQRLLQQAPGPIQVCESCRMRYRIKPLEPQPYYNPWAISPRLFMWLENAARVFDQEAGEERFTASEFVSWCRPDVIRKEDR